MELIKKLEQLKDLIKALGTAPKAFNASTKAPKMGGVTPPKYPELAMPGIDQPSKKDPKKVAEQIKNAKSMKNPIKPVGQEKLTLSKSGQWTLTNEE